MKLRSHFGSLPTCVRVHTHSTVLVVHSSTVVNPDLHVVYTMYVYICRGEGRDEAMASRGQILETKKQPETVLLKYFYFPPENLPSRCHGFIPLHLHVMSCYRYLCTVYFTCEYTWHVVRSTYTYIHEGQDSLVAELRRSDFRPRDLKIYL